MKNTARLLFICLCFAAVDARAQFQIDEIAGIGNPVLRSDYFQYMVRPYRDRAERFSSARVEALQMDLTVDDESGRLTLENWGDNRADMRSGSSRLNVSAGGLDGTTGSPTYSGLSANHEYSGNAAGVYSRFGTFEVEASQLRQKARYSGSPDKNEFKKETAGAGFSFGAEGVRFGLHGNMNRVQESSASFKKEPPNTSVGAALALRAGIFELGATADYVDRGWKAADGSLEVKRSGPALGVQALMKPFGGFTAALRGSMAKLSGNLTQPGFKTNMEGDNKEFGGRVEWKTAVIPLTLVLGFEKLIMNPEYAQGGINIRNLTENGLKSFAAALHFFGGRFLLGVQAQELKVDSNVYQNNCFYSHTHSTLVTMAAGSEAWLLPWLGVRGSVKRMDFQDDISRVETFYNAVAAGVGLKGEKLSLDVTARKMEGDNKVSKQDEFTDVKATLVYKF